MDPITGTAPSSKRIITDCYRFIAALHVIANAKGGLVMGIMGIDVLRRRHRYQAMNRVIKRKSRGGSRTIKPVCKSRFQLHNDVIEIKQDRIQIFLTRCNNNNESLNKFDMADIDMDYQTYTNNINL